MHVDFQLLYELIQLSLRDIKCVSFNIWSCNPRTSRQPILSFAMLQEYNFFKQPQSATLGISLNILYRFCFCCFFIYKKNACLKSKQIRSATYCNNHDDLLHLSFVLKISLFSEASLEPSQTSTMESFCENNELTFFLKRIHHKCSLEF